MSNLSLVGIVTLAVIFIIIAVGWRAKGGKERE